MCNSTDYKQRWEELKAQIELKEDQLPEGNNFVAGGQFAFRAVARMMAELEQPEKVCEWCAYFDEDRICILRNVSVRLGYPTCPEFIDRRKKDRGAE